MLMAHRMHNAEHDKMQSNDTQQNDIQLNHTQQNGVQLNDTGMMTFS
jgi:hypothetical protein